MRVTLALLLVLTGCVVPPPPDPCRVDGENPCVEPNRNQCVVENDQARCLCNAGFLARPSGACEAVGAANCPEHPGDGAEPDDCMARARALKPADPPRSQTVEPVGDYDFFRFDGTARFVYVVSAKAAQGSLFPRIDVYDQGGVWMASDERTGEARLAFKVPASAPYFVRASQSPLDPSVATGTYTLTLASEGEEDHGDLPSEATAVTPADSAGTPTPVNGRFEFPADQDWFSFFGQTTQRYRVAFDAQKGPPPLVALYGASDLTRPLWTAQQETIDFDVTVNETAYLALYAGTDLSSYAFTLTRTAK